MSTWKEDIIEAFKQIGGEGHYADIYDSVESVRAKDKMNKTKKREKTMKTIDKILR